MSKMPLVAHMVAQPILDALKLWLHERKNNYAPRTHVGYEEGGCPTCGPDSIYANVLDYDKLCKEIDAFGEELRRTKGQ